MEAVCKNIEVSTKLERDRKIVLLVSTLLLKETVNDNVSETFRSR